MEKTFGKISIECLSCLERVFSIVVNVNDPKEFFSNQLNSMMTETLFDSVFCRLPKTDNRLPLRIKHTLNDNRQVLEVADAETISRFLVSCSQETKLNVNVILPYVLFYISDQVFLEKIYNRSVSSRSSSELLLSLVS